jgi:hypothetical protein
LELIERLLQHAHQLLVLRVLPLALEILMGQLEAHLPLRRLQEVGLLQQLQLQAV